MSSKKEKRLQGQVALVTGSSSGIGQGIAISLAQDGAKVVINYHSDEDGAKDTLQQIEKDGGEAIIVKADVSDEKEVTQLFDKAMQKFGRLDILINNAGIQDDASLLEMTMDQWQKVIGINLTGPFLCARAAAKVFVEQGVQEKISKAAGKIIYISSVHDIIPWSGRVNYTTSKGGVMMMMKTLAQELASHKIRVNSISPGAIKTDINKQDWDSKEGEKKMLAQIPYGRIGEPEDIAKVASWLATDEADYVTGATIYVDGGMVLYPSFNE
ncbi:SDR family oxidoreductase [Pontibacter qinzhouensis]|uniref:SDR family oxidoreductase n=1 Tax=Pontibacter qinzhouensis TaxID=2603253 RepID=A0A5C8JGZ7_9BACT|nr:SDR family oxidoreductase [Pontibacter qinzhouensis]TXK37019.1 SDR family oxidoreductase [Pontibacter qinzhouensis]